MCTVLHNATNVCNHVVEIAAHEQNVCSTADVRLIFSNCSPKTCQNLLPWNVYFDDV